MLSTSTRMTMGSHAPLDDSSSPRGVVGFLTTLSKVIAAVTALLLAMAGFITAIDRVFGSSTASSTSSASVSELRSSIPAATRETCSAWPGHDAPALARVKCFPGRGVRDATYLRYSSPQSATRAFEAITVNDKGRSCGGFEGGMGSFERREGRSRFVCSHLSDGTPHLAWLHASDHTWGYANGQDLDALVAWLRADG